MVTLIVVLAVVSVGVVMVKDESLVAEGIEQKELVKAQVMGILSDNIKIPGGMSKGGITDKIRGYFSR